MNETAVRSAGRYRRWDGLTLQGSVLFSRRPLAVTRLNDAAADVVAALGTEAFSTPTEVAAETDVDPAATARLLDRLHRRGFLEWAPSRDESRAPPVSIVVTVRNEREAIGACLDALADLEYPAYEVILVDDGSTDGTREAARTHRLADADCLRLVEVGSPSEPLGIGASRNKGVDAARHDVVAFTDADCRPRPNWLSVLVPCLAAHDVVGGRVRPAGSEPVDAYEDINSSLDMGEYAARVDPDGATPYLPTANLLARRSVLDRVPFPERNVAEDVDVCWRAVERGYDVVYEPAGVVEHEYRDDLSAFAGRRSDYGASEALLAGTYRHGERVPLPLGPMLVAIIVLAALTGIVGSPLGTSSTVAIGGLAVVVAGLADAVRRYRRLRSPIAIGTVLRSRGREALSRAYALSVEVTRYYSIPLGLVALALLASGRATVAIVGSAALAVAVALPAVVEYGVEQPSLSPAAYLRFYLADHLGYQCGVYRGAVENRTVAHLRPSRRFRPIGPLAAAATAVASAVAPSFRDGPEMRTVSVDGVQARFRADTSAESWWFDDETLRGERAVLADLLERLTPDDTVLDAGANVGLYACLAGATLRGGRLVAVEPHPANADRLEANLELNGVDARVVRRALASADGDGRLAVPANRAGDGRNALVSTAEPTSAGSADEGSERIDVDVAAGDTLIDRGEIPSPTVIKIDVEGAEFDVFRGLEATLSRSDCRLVYCEVHPTLLESFSATPTDVESFLRDRGFELERIQEWKDRYVIRATRSAENPR